ncbi:hypothetical protein [Kribbella sp. NBC_00359]|uniref:hypothetical protein n=1 Tax=Kribbella sp. NBC_00359 TaxID=2975966 RepID=UPI002E2199D4
MRRLNALQLAEPRSADSGRWDHWLLLGETQRGTPYLVTGQNESALVRPPAFFRNGWHLVLRPRELVTLLMFADLAQRKPAVYAERVGAPDTTRRPYYGITPEVYEAHNELHEFGFLEVQSGSVHAARRAGRVPADVAADHHEGRAQIEALRFKVNWDAAKEDAALKVRKTPHHPNPPRFDDGSKALEGTAEESAEGQARVMDSRCSPVWSSPPWKLLGSGTLSFSSRLSRSAMSGLARASEPIEIIGPDRS